MSSATGGVSGPIPEFLDKVSKNWDLSFVYPKIWAIKFSPAGTSSSSLGSSISRVLQEYKDINNFSSVFNNNNPYAAILQANNEHHVSVGNSKHFLLANKISIPGETLQLATGSVPSADVSGGILWGRAVGSRLSNPVNTNKIGITFFDTNKEILDLLIKPWLAAISYQGLIEDPSCPCLKCDISAYFFAKSSANGKVVQTTLNIPRNVAQFYNEGENKFSNWSSTNNTVRVSSYSEHKPYLRKTIVFKNCIPISTPAKNYNFGPDIGHDEIMSEVDFSYDYYTLTENV